MYKRLLIIGAVLASLAIVLLFGASKAEAQMYSPYPTYQNQTSNFASLYPYPTFQQYLNWYNATFPQQQYPTIATLGNPYPAYPSYPSYPTNPYPTYQNPYQNQTSNFSGLYPYPTYQQYQNWYTSTYPQYLSNYGYGGYSYPVSTYSYNTYHSTTRAILTCAATQIVCSYGGLYCSCNYY